MRVKSKDQADFIIRRANQTEEEENRVAARSFHWGQNSARRLILWKALCDSDTDFTYSVLVHHIGHILGYCVDSCTEEKINHPVN